MRSLSFTAVRIIVGISLVAFLLCLANDRLDLGLFGKFGRQMLLASAAVMVMSVIRFLPSSLEEMQRRRDKGNQGK